MPKISELTEGGAIQPGDSVPAVRSGSTVEIWPTVEQPAAVAGTDTYTVNFGVDVSAGDKVCADFANANTSTAPTLENTGGTPGALTITTRDGSALWAGALSGVHTLQLASGGGSWLVLDPVSYKGAIVESGSNSNGSYVRWENGEQVCWVEEFSTVADDAVTWTYPASFTNSEVSATAVSTTPSGARVIAVTNTGNNGASLRSWNTSDSQNVAPDANVQAWGYWK